MATFDFEIITPQNVEYKDEAKMIIARTIEGDIGIMANHAPLLTSLDVGEMIIKDESDKEIKYYISGGFLEVTPEKVKILADEAIEADKIDVERAKKKKSEHEAKLKKLKEDREIAATQHSLKESIKKIELGSN
ncbi:MAG: ATP synthase F1 subunit epsilon [Fusobacteriota bacterium]